jgi:hypothetical protein
MPGVRSKKIKDKSKKTKGEGEMEAQIPPLKGVRGMFI